MTEPDDIVKIEEEVRRLRKERIASIEHEQAHKNRTHNLPGFFRAWRIRCTCSFIEVGM